MRNRAVKKNCTIPYWLNEKAEAMGLNFSKVLQNALIEQVGEQNRIITLYKQETLKAQYLCGFQRFYKDRLFFPY